VVQPHVAVHAKYGNSAILFAQILPHHHLSLCFVLSYDIFRALCDILCILRVG
jgi:hypothetical protein